MRRSVLASATLLLPLCLVLPAPEAAAASPHRLRLTAAVAGGQNDLSYGRSARYSRGQSQTLTEIAVDSELEIFGGFGLVYGYAFSDRVGLEAGIRRLSTALDSRIDFSERVVLFPTEEVFRETRQERTDRADGELLVVRLGPTLHGGRGRTSWSVGIAAAWVEPDGPQVVDGEAVAWRDAFGWSGSAGAAVALTPRLDLAIELGYLATELEREPLPGGRVIFEERQRGELGLSSIELGLQYRF